MVFEGLFMRQRSGDRSVDASAANVRPASERPSIGLALGGGAARGFAHIGVLRTLTAHGIVPDVIVGTSIGAVVGGTYAANRLDEMEDWARKLTFRGMLGQVDFSLSGAGLISGRRLDARLKAALGDSKIEDLPLRFAAIATEFNTGHEIWLTHGRLVDALRASYALPGIFPPVRIGGRWLVDGALVNPVPVSAARALGARLVIAVGLNSDIFGRGTVIASHGTNDTDDGIPPRERVAGLRGLMSGKGLMRRLFADRQRPGIPTVMIEAFNVMQDRITRARLAGDPPDVSILPRIGAVGWFDFHRAADAIAIGSEAAVKALPALNEAIAALSQNVENGAPPK